jgi:type IV secretory pathway VirB9-like protein
MEIIFKDGRKTVSSFEYDNNGNRIYIVNCDSDGRKVHEEISYYNDKNLPVQRTIYRVNGNKGYYLETIYYEYEFW